MKLKEYDIIKLKKQYNPDLLVSGAIDLPLGSIGTVLMVYKKVPPVYLVEFCNDEGITLALLELPEDYLEKCTANINS